MTLKSLALAASALALAAPGAALANGHAGHGKSHADGRSHAGMPAERGRAQAARGGRAAACPPGLNKKNTGCLPPGQWRQGDRLPGSWIGQYVRYGALPSAYRTRYGYDATNRYLYRDNRVYVIDAATRVIERIVGL